MPVEKKVIFLLSGVAMGLTLLSGCAKQNIEGLTTLNALAQDEKSQEALLRREDQSFEEIRKAIQQKQLQVDLPSSTILKLYGQPVTHVSKGAGTRWIYKGQTSGLLRGAKIYLFFNEDQRLVRWECIRIACDTDS